MYCRPPCAPQHAVRRGSTPAAAAAAADAASADATPAAEPAEERATAEQQPEQRKASGGRGRRDNNRGDAAAESSAAMQLVRIAAETIHTKVAAFLLRTFADHDSSYTVILQAAGAPAYAQALKALARLQQMLADNPSTADGCVVFKARCVQASSERSDGDGSRTFNTMRIVVNLAPKSDWPALALAPISKEDAEADSGKSSSSGSGSSERRVIATAVRMQDSHEEKAQETQRLSKHMQRTSQRRLPAQFLLAGRPDKLASVSAAFLYALDDARMSTLTAGSEPCDLACTIVSQSKTVERFSSADAGKEESPSDAAPAADSDGDDGGAEGASAAAAEAGPFVRNLYFVTVQRCQASKNAISAARSAMRAQQKAAEGGSRRGGSSRTQTRPGYIEVREEEWNQLKEQLQVVPHLTEQLQIMTRQHEQLLSLLATQQGAAQQPSANA